MLRLFHNSICWLLSAVMLLTNGWPVAVQHAHDVGDDPYHHSHQLPAAPDNMVYAASMSEAAAGVFAVTEHVHLLWLGLEVTILPPKGGQPSPSPSAVAVGILAKLADTTAGDDRSSTVAEKAPLIALAPIVASLPSTVFTDSSVRVASLPLCDTARQLRSGVQLI